MCGATPRRILEPQKGFIKMMRFRSSLTGVALCAAGALAALAAPAWAQKAVSVPLTASRMVIDGRLDEAAWKNAGVIPAFENNLKKGAPRRQTEVRLVADGKALYIGAVLHRPGADSMRPTVKERDGAVWSDDTFEVFLDPKAERAAPVHLMVNALATKFDEAGSESYGFNPNWDAAVTRKAGRWTVEMRVPFSEINAAAPRAGDAWLANFCRSDLDIKELSCWEATMGGFDAPAKLQEMVFGSFAARVAAQTPRLMGELKANSAYLSGHKAANVTERLAAWLKRKPATMANYLAWQGDAQDVRDAIQENQRAVLQKKIGEEFYLVREVSPWRGEFAQVSPESKGTELVEVAGLAGQTRSAALNIHNFTAKTLRARLALDGLGAARGGLEVLIPTFVRTADGRPFPDALVPPDAAGQIIIAPGESGQVFMSFHAQGIPAGRYEGTLLITPITASHTDTKVRIAWTVLDPPEPLQKPLSFTWDYIGEAEQTGHVKEYMQSMLDHGINVFHVSGLHHMPRPKADDNGNFLEPVDWTRFNEVIRQKWVPGRKLYISCDIWEKESDYNVYNGKFGSPGWTSAFKKIIQGAVAELKKNGLDYRDFYFNPIDERLDDRYVTIARAIKEADPNILTVEDTVGENLDEVKAAIPYTDCWLPHYNAWQAESRKAQIAAMIASGKPVGFYYYSEGANEKAQDPWDHYVRRLWVCYAPGDAPFFAYWSAPQHYGNAWNRHQSTASYDPSLMYPVDSGVVSSRRWEAWRQGLDDWSLLTLAGKLLPDETKKLTDKALAFQVGPEVADQARQTLILELGKMKPDGAK